MAVRFTDEQVVQATGATRRGSAGARRLTAVCTDTRALVPGLPLRGAAGRALRRARLPRAGRQCRARPARWCKQGRALPQLPEGFALYEVEDTLAALGRPGRASTASASGFPVGAVGGSNGKTTTKEMVGAILADAGPGAEDGGQPQQRDGRAAHALPPGALARGGRDRDGDEPSRGDRRGSPAMSQPDAARHHRRPARAPGGAGQHRGRGRGGGRAVP